MANWSDEELGVAAKPSVSENSSNPAVELQKHISLMSLQSDGAVRRVIVIIAAVLAETALSATTDACLNLKNCAANIF